MNLYDIKMAFLLYALIADKEGVVFIIKHVEKIVKICKTERSCWGYFHKA